MENYDAEKLQNEKLIKKTIKEHLQVDDASEMEALEKMLIYNLLN